MSASVESRTGSRQQSGPARGTGHGSPTVAVLAHQRKTLGGGLGELRARLAEEGFGEPLWYEVPKSRKAPKKARKALKAGADLVVVWGGDGMVQRCVDGGKWFDGKASCVLFGNVGTITGGIRAFDDARPDDGWLDLGVATAKGALEWARTLGRMTTGRSEKSPFVRVTRARAIDVRLSAPMTYELDGGERERVNRLKARVVPGAITVCVPEVSAPRS